MRFGGLYVLWDEPLIVSCLDGCEIESALGIPRPADVIVHPTWLLTVRSLPRIWRNAVRARRSGKRVHFMACAADSHLLLRRLGLPGALVNISAYLNEHSYRPTGAAKLYDAVYAAQMGAYKRLHLAADVPSLFVQTYGECRTPTGDYDLHRFEPRVAHCAFNKSWVSEATVVETFNQSRVGLALSKREGAMLAAVEYMLCGLPLVTTRCRGGRELFFDDRYVEVVDDTPAAVAKAVQTLVSRQIGPDLVRRETLARLRQHRDRLCAYVIEIIRGRGGSPPTPSALFARLFEGEKGIGAHYVRVTDFAEPVS